MIEIGIEDVKMDKVKSENFQDVNDFLRKNYFQLLYCNRNIITLIYIFQEKKEYIFVKDGFVYLNARMEFVDNNHGRSYLKADCIDVAKGKISVDLHPLDYFIDYEWEARNKEV